MWERLGGGDETPSQAYARLRIEMIDAERAELIRLRDEGVVPDDVHARRDRGHRHRGDRAVPRPGLAGHRRARRTTSSPPPATSAASTSRRSTTTPKPTTPDGCEECLRDGTTWVHLRLCMECGHVGCCDSSVYKHATAHFHETDHPVMRSFEPGEAWLWCFADEVLG